MKVFNRLLGLVTAIALIAGAVVLVIEVIAAQFNHDPVLVDWRTWDHALRTTSWMDAEAIMGIGLAAALVVLVLELAPRPPSTLPVTHEPDLDVSVRRRFLERHTAERVRGVDGVVGARVRCRPRRVEVRADTRRTDPRGIGESVRQVVEGELTRLHLSPRPPVHVQVRNRR